MPASTYEYKTVALPQIVQGKRKRGISEADIVAETFGEVIHLEAVDGWEYMRADILSAGTRGGMFSKEPVVTHYSVLVFRRPLESAWPMHQNDGHRGDRNRDDGDRNRGDGDRSGGYRAEERGEGRDERVERVRPVPAPPPSARPSPRSGPSAPSGSAPADGANDGPADGVPAAPVRPRPAPIAPRDPIVPTAPAASAPSTPVRRAPPPIADPTSPLAQGMVLSTGGQFRSEGSPSAGSKPAALSSPGSAATPRPPLGSAQD